MLAEGEITSSKSTAPGKMTTLQWKTTHPRIFGQYNLILNDFFKKKDTEMGGYRRWVDLGRVGGEEINIIKICCIKHSKN